MSLTCTPGGAEDNSYVTAAQADAYFADTLHAATWTGWSAADRAAALVQATAEIERQGGAKYPTTALRLRFVGSPATTTQALHFPRGSDVNADSEYEVPQAVRDAVCEQAHWLLARRDDPDLVNHERLRADGVKNISVDGLSLAYAQGKRRPEGIAPVVWELIQQYIRRGMPTRVG